MSFWMKWCLVGCAVFSPVSAVAEGGAGLSFDEWYEEFRREAVESGVSAQTLDKAFFDLKLLPAVISSDRKQPEFRKDFQSYIDNAINGLRVRKAVKLLQTHKKIFDEISLKYGVPAPYLAAFWGMETNFGTSLGRFSILNALATLAYDTRRPAFFRSELLKAVRMVQKGLPPSKMNGSWAGAMGNFQFMPSTYLEYGVDYDNDGCVDLWNSLPDALASAANYLSSIGWDDKLPWGREVFLPKKFDWTLIEQKRTLREWKKEGVVFPSQTSWDEPDTTPAELFLPAGIQGPAFLVYSNFRVTMQWNNSVLYAIAVGHLADRIQGKPEFIKKYREKQSSFSLEDATEVQKTLAELKLYDGEIDGVLGRRSREAIRRFQLMYDLPGDGYANPSLLHFMRLVVNGEVERDELTFDERVELQQILSKGQYYKGPLDGTLSETVRQGIELYKIVYGIRSDKVGRRLLAKMRAQYLRDMENGEIDPLVLEFRRREEQRMREEMRRKQEEALKKAMEERRLEELRRQEEVKRRKEKEAALKKALAQEKARARQAARQEKAGRSPVSFATDTAEGQKSPDARPSGRGEEGAQASAVRDGANGRDVETDERQGKLAGKSGANAGTAEKNGTNGSVAGKSGANGKVAEKTGEPSRSAGRRTRNR